MKYKKASGKSPVRRERRGVGVIIGGVILAAILLTSVFAFFITILNNDKARTSYEIQSQQESRDKETEVYIVNRDEEVTPAGSVEVNVTNIGSIPMVVSRTLVYCSDGPDCTNTGVPFQDISLTEVLNPGEYYTDMLGDDSMLVGNTYTITVISERGNIISSTTCTLLADNTCSEDSGDGLTEGEVTGIVNEGIIQGTGSLQLDYRAFGAIFPQLGTRDGVDQEGWNVVTASNYGNATGYPAFELPYQAHVIFVEKMRNLDLGGEDIILTRATALLTNQGTIPPGLQTFEYICNRTGTSATAYHESTAYTRVPSVPADADPDEGWVEVYFCTRNPGTGYTSGNGYAPESTNDQLNGIIMVARGTFTESLANYGQTIPYQAAMPGSTSYTTFTWCLIHADLDAGSNCPAATSDSTATQNSNWLVNTADRATMQAGLPIWAHYRGTSLPNSPASVTWIYPDGTHIILGEGLTLNGNENLNQALNLPTTNSDGSPIDCAPGDSAAYYIIKINDAYSSGGKKNVHYSTFRMTCP